MICGVGAVADAMMPDGAALALVPTAKLLEAASSAVDGPETCLRSQLHPAGLIGMTTSDATE